MMGSYAVGLVAVAVLAAAWLAVQRAWLRSVPDTPDGDALAGRTGCGGCASEEACERQRCASRGTREEEIR